MHILEIMDIKPDEDDLEGVVETVNHNAVTISFFDPLFPCQQHVYANGQKYEFSIAAMAYSLEKVKETTFAITEGPMLDFERQRTLENDPAADVTKIEKIEFSTAQLRTMMMGENGADASFQTVVESVAFFQVEGTELCKMSVVLMHNDEENFEVTLYASEHILKGYRPAVGDSIRGMLWLQGYPVRPVDDPANWGDRLTPASPDYDMAGIANAFEVMDYLSDQHPGVVAIGWAIAHAGWDVTKYNNPEKSNDIPAFMIERPGRKAINVWIRAHVTGVEPDLPFSSTEIAEFGDCSAEHGADAAFITVACKDIGKAHSFKVEGLETLEKNLGKVTIPEYLVKPEFRKPIEIPASAST